MFSAVVGLVVAGSNPLAASYVSLEDWKPAAGDRFIVDTRENIGYLAHTDGTFTSTKVASGKQSVVHYGGNTYFAATPSAQWNVQEIDIQTDRLTFGKDGTFMRLYKNGKQETPYGIHSVANIDDLLKTDNRYYSMGCVLVDDAFLGILMKTYELNDENLSVLTIDGLVSRSIAKTTVKSSK